MEDLERIALRFENAAKELRSARLHDGEISEEQRVVLLQEAGKHALRIVREVVSMLDGDHEVPGRS